jgi:hypothetical protein
MYPAFADHTVYVMFHSRTQRLASTVVSQAVRSSTSLGLYAALILSAPLQLHLLAQPARDRLACADQPPVTLTEEQREELQLDCLYRLFLHSEIGRHFALCYTVAYVCTIRGLAPVLLAHHRQRPLLSSIANAANATMLMPTSKYHWMHHYQPRPSTASGRRRHSLSDLSVLPCDCPPDHPRAHAQLRGIVDALRALDLNRATENADDDYEADPEEETAEDDDQLYDGGEE